MAPEQPPAQWSPAFPGQRAPFAPGHELSTRHGAYSPRKVDPLAAEIVAALLADESTPGHVSAPAYRLELWALARNEAQVQLLGEWLLARAGSDGIGDLSDEAVRSAYLLLHRAETRAASARTRLGLTPVSAARLGKNVAQGQAAQADVALRMAALAELQAQGWTPPAEPASASPTDPATDPTDPEEADRAR